MYISIFYLSTMLTNKRKATESSQYFNILSKVSNASMCGAVHI